MYYLHKHYHLIITEIVIIIQVYTHYHLNIT